MTSGFKGTLPMVRLHGRYQRQGGFTLLEIIVTLTILGLAMVLVVGYKPPWSRGLGLRGTAAEIVSGLRAARSEAIVRNRPISFEIDLNAHRFQIGSGPARQLPMDLTITLVTVAGEERASQLGGIRFNPDGSSTGGRLSLADGQHTIALGVDWLTGKVNVTDVP
jgi:general secretion pathway protein H